MTLVLGIRKVPSNVANVLFCDEIWSYQLSPAEVACPSASLDSQLTGLLSSSSDVMLKFSKLMLVRKSEFCSSVAFYFAFAKA